MSFTNSTDLEATDLEARFDPSALTGEQAVRLLQAVSQTPEDIAA